MTSVAAPECMDCARLHRAPDATRITCDAFPDGIPAPLIDGDRLHRKPYPGDRGLRFAPRPADPSRP